MHHCKTEASNNPRFALTQAGVVIIPMLIAVLTFIACCAAVWQWQRSEYHTQKALSASAQRLHPRNLNVEDTHGDGIVTVTGHWLADSTTFISPRMLDARMGAYVVSVLAYLDAQGKQQHIAVQRGWAEQAFANTIPQVSVLPSTPVRLEGEWAASLPRAFELKPQPPQSLGLWQNYDSLAHARLVKVGLRPQILVLLPSSPDTERERLRRIPADQAIEALKQKARSNQAYALQWLGLALVGSIGLAWMFFSRFKR